MDYAQGLRAPCVWQEVGRLAYDRFGAIWGQGVGLQGQSYGIPTMHGGADVIKPIR